MVLEVVPDVPSLVPERFPELPERFPELALLPVMRSCRIRSVFRNKAASTRRRAASLRMVRPSLHRPVAPPPSIMLARASSTTLVTGIRIPFKRSSRSVVLGCRPSTMTSRPASRKSFCSRLSTSSRPCDALRTALSAGADSSVRFSPARFALRRCEFPWSNASEAACRPTGHRLNSTSCARSSKVRSGACWATRRNRVLIGELSFTTAVAASKAASNVPASDISG